MPGIEWLHEALDHGASLVCGAGDLGPLFLQPTVLRIDGLQAASEHRVVREEAFFPPLPVVVPAAARSLLDDAIDFMNQPLWLAQLAVEPRSRCGRPVSGADGQRRQPARQRLAPELSPAPPDTRRHRSIGRRRGEAGFPILRTSHLQGVYAKHLLRIVVRNFGG
ncbi:hypothetical protein [Allorhizocola rhizosphaerae]|uniref:hypothetical protein n=1 Tax=Allorhizocola rhizosphaerae TaxID=1872709 RepID=UPI0013C33621|nr:hypothetical protein [Allorhizocola rhizosphaerae]